MIIISSTASVFAHDCDLVVGKNLDEVVNNYNINYNIYSWALPIEAFKQALINLKAYCCSQVVQDSCSAEIKKNLPTLYPESAYFFDHLIDVSMRRLDGATELAYNLAPDSTATERREAIMKMANNPTGVPARDIEKLYTGYRTLHDIKYDAENFSKTLANYNKNDLATFSLADKYGTLCAILKSLYDGIKSNAQDKLTIGWYLDKRSFFNGCQNLVKERVERENGYVKILMVQKSNQLFNETMQAYTKKHFVEDKLMALRTLINKVKDMFQTIVQQAPASKSCSR